MSGRLRNRSNEADRQLRALQWQEWWRDVGRPLIFFAGAAGMGMVIEIYAGDNATVIVISGLVSAATLPILLWVGKNK